MAAENARSDRLVLGGSRPAAPSMVERAAVDLPPSSGRDKGKASRNKRNRPELGSSSAAVEAAAAAAMPWTGNQPNPYALLLGGSPVAAVPLAAVPPAPVEYPADERERDILLVRLLQSTADAIACGMFHLINRGLGWVADLASPDGRSLQRLASAFAEAFALAFVLPCDGVCRVLQLPQAAPPGGVAAARQRFRAMCPFVRLAGAAANLSVVEAMENEGRVVHVVDLGGADTNQWVELVRLFAARSGGPPRMLRLTVVNEAEDFLSATAMYLNAEAQRLDVTFQFHPVQSSIDALTGVGPLGVIAGQALAVVATLQIHRLLAYEITTPFYPIDGNGKRPAAAEQSTQHTITTRADALLRTIRGLSPKLMILTEQEADLNVAELQPRVWSALNYYAALFDAVEESAPLVSPLDRACVERWLLGEEIRDIVTCKGTARWERHEKLERWAARMVAAGFAPVTMSHALATTETLAEQMVAAGGAGAGAGVLRAVHCGGCFPVICWNTKPVFSVSTWTAKRIVVRPPECRPPSAAAGGSHHGGGPAAASSSVPRWMR